MAGTSEDHASGNQWDETRREKRQQVDIRQMARQAHVALQPSGLGLRKQKRQTGMCPILVVLDTSRYWTLQVTIFDLVCSPGSRNVREMGRRILVFGKGRGAYVFIWHVLRRIVHE